MNNYHHIGIVVISTFDKVFVGPNYDAGVGLGVGVDFLLYLDPVSPSYSKTHSRKVPRFRSVCVEKGVVIISRFILCACAVTWTCSSLCSLVMDYAYFHYSVTTKPPIQWGLGFLSLVVKRPVREGDQWPPSSVEVKDCVAFYLHSLSTPSWRGV